MSRYLLRDKPKYQDIEIKRVKRIERQTYELTKEEQTELDRLSSLRFSTGEPIWKFWKGVARDRNLDYRTILGLFFERYKFSALPLNHNKDWCYPFPLKCIRTPVQLLRGNTI